MFQAPIAAEAKLLDFIASFEAPHGYDTVFGNNQKLSPIRLTAMMLDEVLANSREPSHRRIYPCVC